MSEEKKDEKLTLKKKITIWALLLIIKIVEPLNYSHDYSKELDEIKELVKS